MRVFVVLCLVAVAAAQYDYSPQTVSNSEDGGYTSGVSGGSDVLSNPIQPASEFNKEFYTYSAPDGAFENEDGHDQIANSLKKNLRVIFIKGPESSGLENAALQLAKSANDDRTAIYVLSKQADVSGLADKLKNLQNHHANKPEVHFVKYRTPADAENAQRTIQKQYDALPGTSTNTHGGQAPVLNFASKAQQAAPSSQYIPPAQPQASYLPPGRRF